MSVRELPPGSDADPQEAFVPSSYAAHAVMVSHASPTDPATPAVMIDFDGWLQSELPTDDPQHPTSSLRIIAELAVARGLLAGLQRSIELLENIRRNQEGPAS